MGILDIKPQKQEIPASQLSVKPVELNWMDDDTYNAATGYMNPDEIAKVYKGYNPNDSQPFFQSIYKEKIQAPEKLDEKQVKKASNLSAISDALTLIGQGAAGFAGGHITPIQSAQPGNDANTNRFRELYRARNERYQQGLYGAATQDYVQGRMLHDKDRAGLLSVIQNARSLKNQKQISDTRNRIDMFKYSNDQNLKSETAKESARHNKAMEGAAYLRASKTGSGSGSGSGSGNPATNKNIVEYYDPSVGSFLQIDKNRLAGSMAQVFDALATDKSVFPDYMDVKRQYDALSPTERMNFVQQNWMKSKKAKELMYAMSSGQTKATNVPVDDPGISPELTKLATPAYNGPLRPKDQAGESAVKQEEGSIPEDHIKDMQLIVDQNKDEATQKTKMAQYLKSQGYSKDDIKTILKTITTDGN